MADRISRRLFWLASRLAFGIYRRFPIFGTLRSSIGIIREGSSYLVIDRSDGRGLGLPGGMARPGEPDEQTVRREIAEETGLTVTSLELAFRYRISSPIPCETAVFIVTAKGEIRGSWEGSPRWATLDDLRSHGTESQQQVVEWLASGTAQLPQ